MLAQLARNRKRGGEGRLSNTDQVSNMRVPVKRYTRISATLTFALSPFRPEYRNKIPYYSRRKRLRLDSGLTVSSGTRRTRRNEPNYAQWLRISRNSRVITAASLHQPRDLPRAELYLFCTIESDKRGLAREELSATEERERTDDRRKRRAPGRGLCTS